MATIAPSVLSPSPSPSPAGSTASGLISPPSFPSPSPIRLNEINLFQLQLTVPEDKLGFLTTLLQEDFGYITKSVLHTHLHTSLCLLPNPLPRLVLFFLLLHPFSDSTHSRPLPLRLQASLAWVLVFRVAASQLAETLKSLAALGVGVYFGVLDVIPIWFSLPMFLSAQTGNPFGSSPSSFSSSGTSLSSFMSPPTTQTITQSLRDHAINASTGELPSAPVVGGEAIFLCPFSSSVNTSCYPYPYPYLVLVLLVLLVLVLLLLCY
jgi:hypothetical protein